MRNFMSISPCFRREGVDRHRLQVDRLVVEPVALTVPERVPEPIRIVTGRVVAARLSPSRLPARFGRHDGGFGDLDQVVELEGLDPRSVEGLALVLDRGATHALLDLRDPG